MLEQFHEPVRVNNAEFTKVQINDDSFKEISSKIGTLTIFRNTGLNYKQELKEIATNNTLLEQALYDEKYSIKAVDSLNKLATFDIEGAKIALPLMEENLNRINQNIKIDAVGKEEIDNNKICLQAISSLMKYNSISAKKIIGKYLPYIFGIIEESRQGFDYSKIVSYVAKYGYKKDFEKIKKWWLNFLDRSSFASVDPWFIVSEEPISFERTNNLIRLAFEKYGWHDVGKLLREWDNIGRVENLRTMWNFERHQARGSVNLLRKEFGIANFGRYSPDLLVNQYKERDSFDKPYGVIIYAKDNCNNLALFNNNFILSEFSQSLENKYLLRIIEVESKRDIIKRLILLDKKYGAQQKISFVILGAHGETDKMQLGKGNKNMDVLSIDEVSIETMSKFRRFFSEDVTFILNSCSTGSEGGIGQQLSSTLSCQVIAPDRPCNFYEIKAGKLNEKDSLFFYVRFSNDAKTSIFRNGRKLK